MLKLATIFAANTFSFAASETVSSKTSSAELFFLYCIPALAHIERHEFNALSDFVIVSANRVFALH